MLIWLLHSVRSCMWSDDHALIYHANEMDAAGQFEQTLAICRCCTVPLTTNNGDALRSAGADAGTELFGNAHITSSMNKHISTLGSPNSATQRYCLRCVLTMVAVLPPVRPLSWTGSVHSGMTLEQHNKRSFRTWTRRTGLSGYYAGNGHETRLESSGPGHMLCEVEPRSPAFYSIQSLQTNWSWHMAGLCSPPLCYVFIFWREVLWLCIAYYKNWVLPGRFITIRKYRHISKNNATSCD